MIVERIVWKVKAGCRDEVVKLVKAVAEEAGVTPRVCTFTSGPPDIVTSDFEFETEEERQKFWKDLDWSAPAIDKWIKKHDDLTERSEYHHELLQVH